MNRSKIKVDCVITQLKQELFFTHAFSFSTLEVKVMSLFMKTSPEIMPVT